MLEVLWGEDLDHVLSVLLTIGTILEIVGDQGTKSTIIMVAKDICKMIVLT